jgi:hypothetical protein
MERTDGQVKYIFMYINESIYIYVYTYIDIYTPSVSFIYDYGMERTDVQIKYVCIHINLSIYIYVYICIYIYRNIHTFCEFHFMTMGWWWLMFRLIFIIPKRRAKRFRSGDVRYPYMYIYTYIHICIFACVCIYKYIYIGG